MNIGLICYNQLAEYSMQYKLHKKMAVLLE